VRELCLANFAAVTFLTSPEAGHITGQIIGVNGGAGLGR
jgi:3-oxoacyl-[acyl-carrier protein] reductase